MAIFSIRNRVIISFSPDENMEAGLPVQSAEVYFGRTGDFALESGSYKGLINKEDKLKADRVHRGKDNTTVLLCYTLLRLVLSGKLNKKPEDIIYRTGARGKPEIEEGNLNFNISHTASSFAFAISENPGIGIDLEELNDSMNFVPVVKRFFSAEEAEYILGSPGESRERFFLLWTRKEALLKGIGTGIVPHLSQIEVFRPSNHLDWTVITGNNEKWHYPRYFIYSGKLDNYYLSVAVPRESAIRFFRLNRKNAGQYLH